MTFSPNPGPQQPEPQRPQNPRPAGVVIPVLAGPAAGPDDVFVYAATLAGRATADEGASDDGLVLVHTVARVGEAGGPARESLYHLSFEPRRRDGMPPGEAADALRAFLTARIRQDEARTGIRLARPGEDG